MEYPKTMYFNGKEIIVNNFAEEKDVINKIKTMNGVMH